jgi:hypothetical protein
MPKKPDTKPSPDDVVRYTGLMTRADRARLRYFCERTGQEMEAVGPRWIMERLVQEERKLAR